MTLDDRWPEQLPDGDVEGDDVEGDDVERDDVEAVDSPADREERPSVVDWPRTAKRMRLMVLTIGGLVVVTWLVLGVLGDGPSWPVLAELAGYGLFAVFASELVIVGGSAIGGMLRAGERGDRLSGNDVSLLPPQLTRRRRR